MAGPYGLSSVCVKTKGDKKGRPSSPKGGPDPKILRSSDSQILRSSDPQILKSSD
jgi:hypothetical protein